MRLEITPNFITQEECALLNAWAYEGVVKKWLDVGISSGKLINKRLTSRLYGDRFEYPKEVIELSTKIRSFVGISNYSIIEGHGNRGVVVSFSLALLIYGLDKCVLLKPEMPMKDILTIMTI